MYLFEETAVNDSPTVWNKVRDQLDALATDLVLSDATSLDPERVLSLLSEIRQLGTGTDLIAEIGRAHV